MEEITINGRVFVPKDEVNNLAPAADLDGMPYCMENLKIILTPEEARSLRRLLYSDLYKSEKAIHIDPTNAPDWLKEKHRLRERIVKKLEAAIDES